MTRSEALAEARRRWGVRNARVTEHPTGTFHVGRFKHISFSGGPHESRKAYGEVLTNEGSGPSWEAAFADADTREKK